jgi:hypothetical protein
MIDPDVAKAEDAADPRRQGRSCTKVLRALENPAKAGRHHTAFPMGKKQGSFYYNHDLTLGEFKSDCIFVLKIQLVLVQNNFGPVFYATFGLSQLIL